MLIYQSTSIFHIKLLGLLNPIFDPLFAELSLQQKLLQLLLLKFLLDKICFFNLDNFGIEEESPCNKMIKIVRNEVSCS